MSRYEHHLNRLRAGYSGNLSYHLQSGLIVAFLIVFGRRAVEAITSHSLNSLDLLFCGVTNVLYIFSITFYRIFSKIVLL